MMKRMMGLMMIAGTVVGCGTPRAVMPVLAPAAQMQSVKTSALVLTGGSQAMNSPENSLPIRTTITVTGTKAGQPFKVVVKTYDSHYFYVPTAQTVTVNGVTVPATSWEALSEDLGKATTTNNDAAAWTNLANVVLHFSTPPKPAQGGTTK